MFLYALAHHRFPNYSFYKPTTGSHSKTSCFNMPWRSTVLQSTVFIIPQRSLIQKNKMFLYALAHHCFPNYSFHKPTTGSNLKTSCFNMPWRTTVLQSTVFRSPQQGLIQKQHVLICFGAPLFSKLQLL